MMKTPDQFIEFFSNIPEDRWRTRVLSDLDGRCCALGHLGCSSFNTTPDAYALEKLFDKDGLDVIDVNDGNTNKFPQEHPKHRILAALLHIKKLETV
jgi:hypothetical protein